MIRAGLIAALLSCGPGDLRALTLDVPATARLMAQEVSGTASYFFPTSAYAEGALDGVVAEGILRQTSWKIADVAMTTLDLLAPLRQDLLDDGFKPLFECEARACGGFDFRYQIELLPEPDMHVNLGNFRYFAAQKGQDEFAALVVSRSTKTGFVQLTHIARTDQPATFTTTPLPLRDRPPPDRAGPIGPVLEHAGHAVLDDLQFKTGSSELGEGRFASLDDLAQYLNTHPDRQIKLVGHTDAAGSLDNNVSLSKRRAAAVARRLIEAYGVSADQVSAEGVGYLAPRASNLTEEGRRQNRRVEVILTSTQ